MKTDTLRMVALAAALVAAPLAHSQTAAALNLREPVLRLPPIAVAPVLDGRIHEAEWAGAGMLAGSVGAPDQALEQRQAWAYLAYDKENLYVAIRSATRPGGKLYMWEHDPDEAILSMEGIEVWVGVPHDPAKPPIDRFQIWFDPYGTQWALVHRYGAGFNVQEKLPRGTAIVGDEWHIELAFPWRLAGLTPDDIKDGKHILVRPCRNWRQPGLYTTWGGSGAFYLTDNLIRLVLDSTAPVIRVASLGEPFAGKPAVTLDVRNPGAKPVDVHAQLALSLYPAPTRDVKAGDPIGEAVKTLAVPAGGAVSATLASADADARLAEPGAQERYAFQLNVTRPSDGALLFSRFMKVQKTRNRLWGDIPVRPVTMRGGYYPYFGKVKAQVDLGDDPRKATITRAVITVTPADGDKPIATGEIAAFLYGKGEAILEVGALPAGRYVIRGDVFAGAEKLAVETPIERAFTREIMPWENNTVGITEKVYPPFTPIAVRDNTLSTVLRDHALNGLGFWDQVVAKGQPILAAPMRLEARAGGQTLAWQTPAAPRFIKKAGHETTLEGESACAALTVKTRCIWEYDGMMKVELDLAPAGDGRVDELELVIPVKAAVATLMHSTTATRSNPSMAIPAGNGVVWDSRSMVQSVGKGTFTPYIWIGGVERGVCWFADNDQGWITDDREAAVEIERAGDTVNLRIRLINKPGVMPGPRRIVFGLMATPVKPIPAESRAWWNDKDSPRNFVDHLPSWRFAGFSNTETLDPLGGDFSIFEYFAQHQGTFKKPADSDEFLRNWMLKHIEDPDKGGLIIDLKSGFNRTVNSTDIVFYTNPAIEAGNTPQGRQFINEWRSGVSGMGCNFVKSYNDYAAWCYDQMLASGLKCGVYHDNTFPVASTDLIAGSAYVREDGRIQAGWNMFGHREFYKRLFVAGWERMGKMPFVYPHTTNAKCVPLFSFATIHLALEWEQKSLRTFQEKFQFPLLRTEVMGKQSGLIPRILCSMGEGSDQNLNGYLHRTREGTLLLHDSYARGLGPYFGEVVKELMPLGFHLESCDYVGYWEKSPIVTAPAGTEVSLFKMEKGLLAVVVDTSGEEGVRRVTFDEKALGRPIANIRDIEADLRARQAANLDRNTQRTFDSRAMYFHPDRDFRKPTSNTVEFNLRKHDYCLLLIE